ncbi:triacylglycerol lipase [Propionibacteriaceae bacterium ES.041]|nr:triacylglycerol lipase [Propionibacteriaceae bacterium ES.041]
MPVLGMVLLVAIVALALVTVLDLIRRVPLICAPVLALAVPVILNAPLLGWYLDRELGGRWRAPMIVLAVLLGYLWLRLQLAPIRDGVRLGPLTKILGGATPILYSLCYATILQAIVLPVVWVSWGALIPTGVLVTNLVWSVLSCLLLYLNGALRAVLLSKSLSVVSRVFLLGTLWIPVLGWIAGVGAGRTVRREYLAAVDRAEWERELPTDDRCATRYPILLVHGVGWRDRMLFNAWGRIPRYLKRHGASIYHGEQEAWGTIEENGKQVAARIAQVCEQTGSPKVNVIAHSRGGIDSRYAISTLGMGDRVASLTTMNTPHHGVRFADTATKLREPIYLKLAAVVNWIFAVAGDTTPDFLTSTMAFRTELAREFNRNTPDHPAVHYQSYTSVMSSAASDPRLAVPYRVIKALGEENDGLVSVDSAKWGEFRGVFRSTGRRGVSHGDLVDYNREDFHGFNVLAEYIQIVGELKQRGY